MTYYPAIARQVRDKNDAGVEELRTVHRFAPASDTDSCFGEISLVSGAKPYGGNIVARSAGEHTRPRILTLALTFTHA